MSNAGRRGMCRRRPQERRIRGLGGSCLGASGRLLARRSRPLRTGAVSIRVGAAHAYSPGHGRGASGVGETVVRRCDADRLLHAWPGTLERDVAKAAVARKATLNRCFLLPFSAIASAASRRSPRREISVDRAAAGRRAPGRRSPSYSATRLTGASASHRVSPGSGRSRLGKAAPVISNICCSVNIAIRPNRRYITHIYCTVNLGGNHASCAGERTGADRSVPRRTSVATGGAGRTRTRRGA